MAMFSIIDNENYHLGEGLVPMFEAGI